MLETCPECKSANVRRSQRRNSFEAALSWVRLFPWRCEGCKKRFYRFARRTRNRLPRDHRRHERSRWQRIPLPARVQLVGYALGAVLTLAFLGWLAWGGLE